MEGREGLGGQVLGGVLSGFPVVRQPRTRQGWSRLPARLPSPTVTREWMGLPEASWRTWGEANGAAQSPLRLHARLPLSVFSRQGDKRAKRILHLILSALCTFASLRERSPPIRGQADGA